MAKPIMKDKRFVYTIKDLPQINIAAESMTRFILSDNALVSFIENPPGTEFPLHSHDAEQILVILEGSEDHVIDGKKFHLEAGDVCVHPANVEHGGVTKTGFKGIDIFVPPRESHVDLMKKHGLIEEK